MKNIIRLRLKNLLFSLCYLFVGDLHYNKWKFYKKLHYRLNLSCPETFAEKLIYLKMYYKNPLQNLCADKFTVREYVKACGYPEILKEVYQVCESPDEINLAALPDKFFIQCSHTQGHNYIIEKKDEEKLKEIKKLYRFLLKRKHYKVLRENCYKNITPRIICCEYLAQPGMNCLTDYKF